MSINNCFYAFIKEKSYKFDFCKNCAFYECEYIKKCEQYARSHASLQNNAATELIDTDDSYYVSAVAANPNTPDAIEFQARIPSEPYEANYEVPKSHKITSVPCPSYNPKEFENGCIMSNSNITQIECGTSNVTEGIGNHYEIKVKTDKNLKFVIAESHKRDMKEDAKEKWEPSQPVFISAQTGFGKNYFIENTLIPYLKELNYKKFNFKILIISNRLALKSQIKERIGNEEIFKLNDVADVMTYQSILKNSRNLKNAQNNNTFPQKYLYVICDEAHFFTSDAMFNPYTQEILNAITSIFQNAIRIYMSATPYECLEYILESEGKFEKYMKDADIYVEPDLLFYHFKRDYSYLDIYAFYQNEVLFNQIIEKIKKGEKWLIFFDDKKGGEKLRDKLIEFGEEHDCPIKKAGNSNINQESDKISCDDDNSQNDTAKDQKAKEILVVSSDNKDDPQYISLITNEKPDKNIYVIIATSVLDNGINLNGIQNIVVFESSMVKSLQMVGRARVNRKNPNDRKTLYIKRFDINDMQKAVNKFQKYKNIIHEAATTYNTLSFLTKYIYSNNTLHDDFVNLFSPSLESPHKPKVNKIAVSLIERKLIEYQAILKEMEQEKEDGKKVGQTYLEQQFAWFGKDYSEEFDLDLIDFEKNKKIFIAFLEKLAKNEIHIYEDDKLKSEKDMKKSDFQNEFKKLHDAAFEPADKNKNRQYSKNKINTIFEDHDLPFELVSEGNPTYWIIKKANTTNDNTQ